MLPKRAPSPKLKVPKLESQPDFGLENVKENGTSPEGMNNRSPGLRDETLGNKVKKRGTLEGCDKASQNPRHQSSNHKPDCD
jgi:hypothetical protein